MCHIFIELLISILCQCHCLCHERMCAYICIIQSNWLFLMVLQDQLQTPCKHHVNIVMTIRVRQINSDTELKKLYLPFYSINVNAVKTTTLRCKCAMYKCIVHETNSHRDYVFTQNCPFIHICININECHVVIDHLLGQSALDHPVLYSIYHTLQIQ